MYMHRNGQEIDVAFMFGNKDELAEFLNVSENWAELDARGMQRLNIQIGSYRAWNGPEWRS